MPPLSLHAALPRVQAINQHLQPLWGQVLVRLGACEVMVGNYQRGEQLLQDGLQLITQDLGASLYAGVLGTGCR